MKEQEKISLLEKFLLLPDGRKKSKALGLEKMFDKEIERIKNKPRLHLSFQEMSILGFDGLAKQKPVTLEEARAQAKRIHDESKYKSKEDIQKMTMDEKRSYISFIVRFPDGRTIAQQVGIENLFDEYLEDIKMRLPKIDRREWVFLRIQEFASKKDVTDEEKKLHEEYLHYGNREETFEQYIQLTLKKNFNDALHRLNMN